MFRGSALASELLDCFETLRRTGVDLSDQQGVDTTTPAGRALFGMAGVFAEFERSMLIERTRAGLDRARAQGKRLGRPVTPDHVTRRVLELRRAGMGMDRIARELGIGKSVAQRICQASACCLARLYVWIEALSWSAAESLALVVLSASCSLLPFAKSSYFEKRYYNETCFST